MFAVAAIPVLVQGLMVQASFSALLALSPSPGANNKETLTGWTPSRASFMPEDGNSMVKDAHCNDSNFGSKN